MARKTYTEDDKNRYIELAAIEGIEPARRKLGYPGSYNTAAKWLDERGVVVTTDTLKAKAGQLGQFYGQREQMYSLQTMLDTIQTKMETENLSPDGIAKLAGALQKIVTTMELVAGRVTSRTESLEGMDPKMLQLLERAQAKNLEAQRTILELEQDKYGEIVDAEIVEESKELALLQ